MKLDIVAVDAHNTTLVINVLAYTIHLSWKQTVEYVRWFGQCCAFVVFALVWNALSRFAKLVAVFSVAAAFCAGFLVYIHALNGGLVTLLPKGLNKLLMDT